MHMTPKQAIRYCEKEITFCRSGKPTVSNPDDALIFEAIIARIAEEGLEATEAHLEGIRDTLTDTPDRVGKVSAWILSQFTNEHEIEKLQADELYDKISEEVNQFVASDWVKASDPIKLAYLRAQSNAMSSVILGNNSMFEAIDHFHKEMMEKLEGFHQAFLKTVQKMIDNQPE